MGRMNRPIHEVAGHVIDRDYLDSESTIGKPVREIQSIQAKMIAGSVLCFSSFVVEIWVVICGVPIRWDGNNRMPAMFQHAKDLANCFAIVLDVFKNVYANHVIEFIALKRNIRNISVNRFGEPCRVYISRDVLDIPTLQQFVDADFGREVQYAFARIQQAGTRTNEFDDESLTNVAVTTRTNGVFSVQICFCATQAATTNQRLHCAKRTATYRTREAAARVAKRVQSP